MFSLGSRQIGNFLRNKEKCKRKKMKKIPIKIYSCSLPRSFIYAGMRTMEIEEVLLRVFLFEIK